MNERIGQYLDFIVEIDRLKAILRQSRLFDGSRYENDAEHSWTISVMALLFRDFSDRPVDISRVIYMLLIHDIVEVDAGDTFLYAENRGDAEEKERLAAQRIFGMLDAGKRDWFIALWEEFEARETAEARFAAVFDRLEPLYQNFVTQGYTWKKHGVKKAQVIAMNSHLADGSREIGEFVDYIIEESVRRGYLAE